MKRTLLAGLIAAAALSLLAGVSFAQAVADRVAIRLSPLPERVATADAVVVGKVTAIEDKTVSAEMAPGAKEKTEYHVAVIKVADDILGAKGLTHIKVGFVKPAAPVPGKPPIIRPGGGYAAPQPTVDQEGCFFLTKHHSEPFYLLQGYNSVINKAGNDNFDKDVARAKECAKLLADPKAGLKSKDADTRALTAEMLAIRYTTPRAGQTKREAIDADESKLILTALAEADWTKNVGPNDLSPQWGFARLGLTDKDGWNAAGPFNTPNAYQDAAKAWLKGHADTYRIQRYVAEKKDDKKDEKKDK